MKSAVVIVLLALCSSMVLGETLQDHAKKVMEKIVDAGTDCAEKLGASPDDIQELMKEQIPSAKAGQCVVTCVHKVFGLQKQDGTINKDTLPEGMDKVKAIDEDIYNKMVSVWKICTAIAESADECDTGLNLLKCMHEESHKVGLTKESMGF